jgi:hypothetical protein
MLVLDELGDEGWWKEMVVDVDPVRTWFFGPVGAHGFVAEMAFSGFAV